MVQSISVLITKGLAIGLAIVPIGDLRIVPSRIDPTQEFSHTMGNIRAGSALAGGCHQKVVKSWFNTKTRIWTFLVNGPMIAEFMIARAITVNTGSKTIIFFIIDFRQIMLADLALRTPIPPKITPET